MKYKIAVHTDIGERKVNQDAFTVRVADTDVGRILLAILCDGMGGLDDGEIASEGTVEIFEQWFENKIRDLVIMPDRDKLIIDGMIELLQDRNEELIDYGIKHSKKMGTTFSALLLIENYYLLLHVGDSRIYHITKKGIEQLTMDHSVVAEDVRKGILTPEMAKTDERRNVLKQCIGVRGAIEPQIETGKIEKRNSFLLCSDGFVHENAENELSDAFRPKLFFSEKKMQAQLVNLTKKAFLQGETDNTTTVLLQIQK